MTALAFIFAANGNLAILACGLLAAGLLLYVFTPPRHVDAALEKTRLIYLGERKDAVYENLRDLNFEYKAGKFPEGDYQAMREQLEAEAASILAEIERLENAAITYRPPAGSSARS